MDQKTFNEILAECKLMPTNDLWRFAKAVEDVVSTQENKYDEGFEAGYDAAFIEAAEALASWMRSRGMSPGYAATFTELLGELKHETTLQPAR